MIRKVIGFCTKNRLLTLLLVLLLVGWGWWSLKSGPLDAIPDLSDTQVIIYTDWPGRGPDLVEDQVTYPIVSTLLAAPQVESVRGFSFLGSSFIYVIFKDGTDIYWARSRVLEYLQAVKGKIPSDVNPVLGPDASGVGWGFSYALVDKSGKHDLSSLRTIQDYNVKLALESVPGVAQVASVGGFVKQYQVHIDPNKLLAYGIPLTKVFEAIRRSNSDVEGRVIDFSGAEYVVRGRGYIKTIADLEMIPLGTDGSGTPVLLRDFARVQLGPEIRRGVADLDGNGEVSGGIVVVRYGENVLSVLERVKERIRRDIEPSLPEGVTIVTTYDRSDLVQQAVDTLKNEIYLLLAVVSAITIVFLFHLPSALIVLLTLPCAILVSFIFLYYLKVTTNIMSLSGIAISIGVLVDASIVMVENAHKKIEEAEEAAGGPVYRPPLILEAAKEVGPSLFFALIVITVAFLPVFALQGQSGRLFRPLAYAKTFSMLAASLFAVTMTPVLMTLFLKGPIRKEQSNPLNRFFQRIYEPAARFSLAHPFKVILGACGLVVITAIFFIWPFRLIGSEFMPPLYEGALFYMPVTTPGISIGEATKLLKIQDEALKKIPEVAQVFGKAGRAETATDPAPLEMFETVINLKPRSQWRKGMTVEKLTAEMNDALTIPGVSNAFTTPIKARIDMLSTGIRTTLGLKIFGPDLAEIERIGIELEKAIRQIPGTRSVYAERANTGYYLDVVVKRGEAARYNLTVDDVNTIVQSAVGGLNVTTTIEGRGRFPVNIRYFRDARGDLESIGRIMIPVETPKSDDGQQAGGGTSHIPLGQVAEISVLTGPSQIKSEAGMLTAYVYIDQTSDDQGGYIGALKKQLSTITPPPGYRIELSGEYQNIVKRNRYLAVVIPLTIFLIVIILFFSTGSLVKTGIVLLAVPFSLIGSLWLLYLLGYNMSTAVWVGLIALAGLDAETGVVMLLYLDLSFDRMKKEGRLTSLPALKEAIMEGAVKRLRPKLMTVATDFGLILVIFDTGIGSEVMKRIGAPIVGGLVTSLLLELLVYPAIYLIWRRRKLPYSITDGST